MDQRLVELRKRIQTRKPQPGERDEATREAAVALLVRPNSDLELLLIKRALHERDPWSGHIALPGGRRDSEDADLIVTAIRETYEEVHITINEDHWLGALDEVAPRTPRLPPLVIAPFVFAVTADVDAAVDAREVEAAMWVPLAALRDPEAVSEILIEFEGGSRSFPSLKYGEHVIWGLTHRILTQFLELAAGL